jgi:hypothetical protein
MSVAALIGVVGVDAADTAPSIHDSVDSYARSGWPDTTPGYAVRDYPDLLVATGDTSRLSALARDPRRHAFLLRATGSDYAAEAEIAAAQRLLAGQDEPDLQALLELAVYRNAMALRNQCLPFALPGVWARLGRLDHGEALARAIPDPDARAAALEDVATVAAQAGDPDRAETLARTIADPQDHAQVLDELATDAEALARTITDPEDLSWALIGLASATAEAGDPDRAEALARAVPDPDRKV